MISNSISITFLCIIHEQVGAKMGKSINTACILGPYHDSKLHCGRGLCLTGHPECAARHLANDDSYIRYSMLFV